MKVNAANATKRGANANAKGAKALVNKNAKKIVNAANAIKTAVVGTAKAVQGSFNDRMKIKRNSLKIALEKLNLTEAAKKGYVSQVTLNGNINTILTEARKVDRKRLNNKLLIAKKQGNLNTVKKLQKIKQNTIEAATNAMKKKRELLNKRKKSGTNTNAKPNNNTKPNNNAKPANKPKQPATKSMGTGTNKPKFNTEFMGPNKNKLNTIEEEPTQTKLLRTRWKLVGKTAVKRVLKEKKKKLENVENIFLNDFKKKVNKLEESVKSGKANKKNLESKVNNLTNQLKKKKSSEGKMQKDKEALMKLLSNIGNNLGGSLTVNQIQPRILELKKRVSNAIQYRNQAVDIADNLDNRLENTKNRLEKTKNQRKLTQNQRNSVKRKYEIEQILGLREHKNLNSTKRNEFFQKYTTGNSKSKTTKQLREELRVEMATMTKNKPNTSITFKTQRQRAKEANAAVMIQKTVRGRQNRKKVAKMRANNEKEVVAKPVRVNPLFSQEQQPKPNTTVNNKPKNNNNKKNLEIRKKEVRNIARKGIGGVGIGNWAIAISKATSNDINTLKKRLLEKQAYRNQIKAMNNLGIKKTKHLREVWNLNINVEETKKLVEANREELKKKAERERNKREVDKQKAKNNLVEEFKKKREAAKNKIQVMNLNETNKKALLEKINNTGTTTLLKNVLRNAETKQTSKRLEKARVVKAEKAEKKAGENAAKAAEKAEKARAKAAKEAGEKAAKAAAKATKEAGEKAAKEAKEAEEKATKEAADKAKVETEMRKKVKRDIEKNIRLNAKTKAALTKRINNGKNIKAVKNGLKEVRNKANKERTKAAVMIQKTQRGRQNRQKVAKMRANEKEGVARAQSNLKASKERNAQQERKNQAARVINKYNIPKANKQGFINNLKTTKTQQNIKIIQERAKRIHNAAVTNKKMAAKAAEKAAKEAVRAAQAVQDKERAAKREADKAAKKAVLNAKKQKAKNVVAGYNIPGFRRDRFIKDINKATLQLPIERIQTDAKKLHNKTVKNRAEANRKAKANAAKKRQSAALRKRLNSTLVNTKPKNPKRRP